MAVFDLPCSPLPLLLITLFVATLTLSVNVVAAGTSSVSSALGRGSPTDSLSPSIEPPDATGGKKASRYSSVAEGGPILISTSQHRNIEVTSTESNKLDEVKKENAPKERHASSSVVARKGVKERVKEKIKPRKGVENITKSVDQNLDSEKENVFDQTTFKNIKPVMESTPVIETAHKSETSNSSIPKLNSTNSRSDGSLNHNINSSYSNASLISVNGITSYPEVMNNTKESLHIEKHIPKPKPTVTTVDGPEINESIPLSRTKNPPLGMPRKIDYIVPVIITIVALPILGAAIFILYRRGRDCWDKRHYRRMDFLIDGMYND